MRSKTRLAYRISPPCPICGDTVGTIETEWVSETVGNLCYAGFAKPTYTLQPCGHEVFGFSIGRSGNITHWDYHKTEWNPKMNYSLNRDPRKDTETLQEISELLTISETRDKLMKLLADITAQIPRPEPPTGFGAIVYARRHINTNGRRVLWVQIPTRGRNRWINSNGTEADWNELIDIQIRRYGLGEE